MADKVNEDYFEISFEHAGTRYEGQAWIDYEKPKEAPIQITFHAVDSPENGKIIFLCQADEGQWEQRPAANEAPLPDELIQAIGRKIEIATE